MGDVTFGDTDDEDNENAISLEKIKNESGFLADGLLDDEDKKSVIGFKTFFYLGKSNLCEYVKKHQRMGLSKTCPLLL